MSVRDLPPLPIDPPAPGAQVPSTAWLNAVQAELVASLDVEVRGMTVLLLPARA